MGLSQWTSQCAVLLGDAVGSTLGATFICEGNLECDTGNVINNGTINGLFIGNNAPTGTGTIRDGSTLPSPTNSTALIDINDVVNWFNADGLGYYLWGDQLFHADTLPSIVTNSTLNPTATNPAGVFIAPNAWQARGSVTINGTLVIKGGATISTTVGSGLLVTPSTFFPAVICQSTLTLANNAAGVKMNVNGLLWIGKQISTNASTAAATAQLTINGALVHNDQSPFPLYTSNKFPTSTLFNPGNATNVVLDPQVPL